MILGKALNVGITLKELPYIKVNSAKFIDKNKKLGATIGGKFASLDDIKKECHEYDVYIHTLQEMTRENGAQGYWMVYACRHKTAARSTGTTMYRRRSW